VVEKSGDQSTNVELLLCTGRRDKCCTRVARQDLVLFASSLKKDTSLALCGASSNTVLTDMKLEKHIII
jgi:hypothetical protein